MEDWLIRQRMLIGNDATDILKSITVMIVGIGGVGSYAVEALARAGIGNFVIIDNDTISITNLNRQIMADTETVGRLKVEVMAERIKKINPTAKINAISEFVTPHNFQNMISNFHLSYIVDAIDTVTSKLTIIETAKNENIPVISSMGTGNKLDPTRFRICDISKTNMCPLAKVMRYELKKRGVQHVDVLFSDEEPHQLMLQLELESKTPRHIPASISFIPSVAGLIIAGHVIKQCTAF